MFHRCKIKWSDKVVKENWIIEFCSSNSGHREWSEAKLPIQYGKCEECGKVYRRRLENY